MPIPECSAGAFVRMSEKSQVLRDQHKLIAYACRRHRARRAAQAFFDNRVGIVTRFREQALKLNRQILVELDPRMRRA